jgi:lactate racemase
MRQRIVHGDAFVDVELPDRTHVVSSGVTTTLEPAADVADEVRRALDAPLDLPPLRDLARGKRVTVAFDDATVPCFAPVWTTAMPMILGDLASAGVPREEVTLVCANALHRQFTHEELARLIGEDVVRDWGDRLVCHDAEDPSAIEHLGTTASGYEVDLSRHVTESDLTVYLNCATTRGFSGGWKSICVGLSTYRTIAYHHNPDDMSMSIDRNRMHDMLNEMGALVVERLGRERIFKVETVLANPLQVARVFGGTVGATRAAALDLNRTHTVPRRSLLDGKADVVLYGVPDWSPYAAFSHTNPLLTLYSTALGYLGGMIEALGKPGCTVVLSTPCLDRWDRQHHPSYREVWERVVPETKDPYVARERFEEEFATRDDYREAYRHGYGFHGVHPIMAMFPLKRLRHAGNVIVAGAEDPGVVRHAGFEPAASIDASLARAYEIHGADASIAYVPYPPAINRQ